MTNSPCKAGTDEGSCEITNLHDFCLHCGRDINEISRWSEMTHPEKRQANINAKKRLNGLWHK